MPKASCGAATLLHDGLNLGSSRAALARGSRALHAGSEFTRLTSFQNGLSAILARRQLLQVLGRLKQVELGLEE